MANNEKTIAISTIPIPKLSALMNNFICNTITHLNKLSVKGDEKLAEFDQKLNDLDIMTTLLEAKLNSLPETITSTYPPIEPIDHLDSVHTIINSKNTDNDSGTSPVLPPSNSEKQAIDNQSEEDEKDNEEGEQHKESKEGDGGEVEGGDPKENLENFLKSHEKYRTLYMMLKAGVPIIGVEQKAKLNGFDMDLLEVLIDKTKKVIPSIS